MKKITALILCFIFCFFLVSLGAENFSGVNNDTEINVSGVFSSVNTPVTLIVLNPGKSIEDLTSEYDNGGEIISSIEAIAWFGQTLTDETGAYTFLVKFSASSAAGDYILVAVCGNEKSEGILRYVSNANKINAIEAFSRVSSIGELKTAMTDYSFTLSIFEGDDETKGIYEKFKEDERFFNIFKEFGVYSSEVDELNNSASAIRINIEVALKLVETEEIEDVELLSEFVTKNSNIFGLDLSQVTEENHDYIYENILNLENINEVSDIQSSVNDSIILYGINNSLSWGNIQSILTSYATDFEINLSDPGVDYVMVYQSLFNEKNSLNSIEIIKSRFNILTQIHKKATVMPGGGGGGGGGSSTSKKEDGVISKPVISVPEEEIKEEVKEMKFVDVQSDFWACGAIKNLYEKNILKGKSEELFGINNFVTREEIAAILVRAFNLEMKDNISLFNDVSSKSWYASDVSVASSNGILKGYPDGSFGVGKNITRQDLAVMLYNLIKSENIKLPCNESKSFSDSFDISDYAKEAVSFMTARGIINGYSDGSFRPIGTATRAEAAYLINGLLTQVNQ